MKKYIFLFLVNGLFLTAKAQTSTALNLPRDAKIEGFIAEMKTKQPLNNELIVFKSQKNLNEFQALSDEAGKFNTRLPAGDKYYIYVMGFKDSTSYNIVEIPSLPSNSYYKNPFTVNIEFDPAKTFVLENVEFDFGKADLRPSSYQTLDDLVDYLNRKTTERIEIGGYTDNIGSDAKNHTLSMNRAKTIVAYLVSKGIGNERLVAKGYGAEDPIEDNSTEAGRQKNRRTEVKILE
jgi:Outer membrane protein and related peptidoglycan-associated (lipo)proteins